MEELIKLDKQLLEKKRDAEALLKILNELMNTEDLIVTEDIEQNKIHIKHCINLLKQEEAIAINMPGTYGTDDKTIIKYYNNLVKEMNNLLEERKDIIKAKGDEETEHYNKLDCMGINNIIIDAINKLYMAFTTNNYDFFYSEEAEEPYKEIYNYLASITEEEAGNKDTEARIDYIDSYITIIATNQDIVTIELTIIYDELLNAQKKLGRNGLNITISTEYINKVYEVASIKGLNHSQLIEEYIKQGLANE